MKNLFLSGALALALAGPASANDVEKLANEYAQLPGVVLMMDDMLSPKSMAAQFEAGLPPGIELSDDKRQRIGVVMSKGMMEIRPRLEELMVEGMISNFSAAELQALIDFYSSEHGGTVMRKMQPFMQQVMGQLGPELQAMQTKMIPKVIKIVQE